MRPIHLTGCLLLAIAGCAPTVRTTYISDARYPARDAEAEIRLYSAGAPECPFEELGLLTSVLQAQWFTSREDAVAALQKQARRLGAHAIVGLEPYDVPSGDDYAPGFKGTAVRFTDDGCTR